MATKLRAAKNASPADRVKNAITKVTTAAGAVVEVASEVADMVEQLRAIKERVARAPAHVVATANIVNGMDPTEINRSVLAAMDAHGLE